MVQHIDSEGDCPLAVVNCRYADVACKYKVYPFLLLFKLKVYVRQAMVFFLLSVSV